jgi:hypothetical protein
MTAGLVFCGMQLQLQKCWCACNSQQRQQQTPTVMRVWLLTLDFELQSVTAPAAGSCVPSATTSRRPCCGVFTVCSSTLL